MSTNKFTNKLNYLIKTSGITQTKISDDLGIKKQKLSQWKSGYIEPNIDDLIKLAKYFNVTIDYLVGYENEDGTRTSEKIEYTTTLKYERKKP